MSAAAAPAATTNGDHLADALAAKAQLGKTTTNGASAANDESGDEDDDDGDDDEANAGTAAAAGTTTTATSSAANKKKKKKKSGAAKKKAKAAKASAGSAHASQLQTDPPTVGLTKIFTNGVFPVGEIQKYDEDKFDDNRKRVTAEELRERERIAQEQEGGNYNLIRRAAEVHRQVRQYARRAIQPGMPMLDVAKVVEDGVKNLVEVNGLEAGIGFPTGLSLNECAAHYTPNPGDKRVLQATDVLKVDIGVQVQGRICDSAFTLTFGESSPWTPLLDAVRAATNAGIREAGIDVRLGDVGAAIQEVMESHEFEVDGKTHRVKCVQNLNGHNIGLYAIHASKSVPIVAMPNLTTKMEEGEYFAIETFGTTGRGYVQDSGECSHYARKLNAPKVPLRVQSARPLLATINKEFGSLPWCRRYLEEKGVTNYLLGLRHLVQSGIVQDYPPLSDLNPVAPGMPVMTAQFEHTILLRPTCKEVVSRGEDY